MFLHTTSCCTTYHEACTLTYSQYTNSQYSNHH